MKVFVAAVLIIAVFCGVAMAGDEMAEKKAFMKACQEETKATDQDIEDLNTGKNPSAAAKCTAKCLMEKTGVMDAATGEFFPDRLKAKFVEKPKMAEAVDKCKGQKGTNPCETAYMISDCIMKNGVKV